MATPTSVFALSLITVLVEFGLAIVACGGMDRVPQPSGAIVLVITTVAMSFVAPFSCGNLSSGEQQDRSGGRVFIPFSVIAPANAILPAYARLHSTAPSKDTKFAHRRTSTELSSAGSSTAASVCLSETLSRNMISATAEATAEKIQMERQSQLREPCESECA